jgi:hypothetical protein
MIGGDAGPSADYNPGGYSSFDPGSATSDFYKARNAARTPIVPGQKGAGYQNWLTVPEHLDPNIGASWQGLADLIGYKGPMTETTGQAYAPSTFNPVTGESSLNAGWSPTTGVSYDFQKAMKDYYFGQHRDASGNYFQDIYSPTGKLIGSQRTGSGEDIFTKYLPGVIESTVGALGFGPLAGEIGAGAEAAVTGADVGSLGELGINTGLAAGTAGAPAVGAPYLGAAKGAFGGAVSSGIQGKNVLKGALKGAALGGVGGVASPYIKDAASTVGSTVSDVAGSSLGKIAQQGTTGALQAAVPALLQGKSLKDALELGGLSGALGGAYNEARSWLSGDEAAAPPTAEDQADTTTTSDTQTTDEFTSALLKLISSSFLTPASKSPAPASKSPVSSSVTTGTTQSTAPSGVDIAMLDTASPEGVGGKLGKKGGKYPWGTPEGTTALKEGLGV